MRKQLQLATVQFGCDPEFFFERNGEVVGSEKVLTTTPANVPRIDRYGNILEPTNFGRFVQDGVQVELNPNPNHCRANLSNEIKACFLTLREHLAKTPEIKASFRSVVEVSSEEMASLGAAAKALGCAPSINAHDTAARVQVDGSVYRKRSAGGHIHLGLDGEVRKHATELVPLLDVVLGNTCVLIDRDPGNVERRQNYGRAGEYRLPKHGLEYRTLSNFWLRNYRLMSLVMGLARMTVYMLHTKLHKDTYVAKQFVEYSWDPVEELMTKVDMAKVVTAINTNDRYLAWENFQVFAKFLLKYVPIDVSCGLWGGHLKSFEYFLHKIDQGGIEAWFPQDPMEHWCNKPEGHGTGWESFLVNTVAAQVPLKFTYSGIVRPLVEVPPPVINIQDAREAVVEEVRNEQAGNVVTGEAVCAVEDPAAVERRAAAKVRAAGRRRDRSGRFVKETPDVGLPVLPA